MQTPHRTLELISHRISLEGYNGSDDWVDVTMRRAQLQAALAAGAGRGEAAALAARMAQCITGWSLRAEEGDAEPLPVTEAVILHELDAHVVVWLAEQIQAYYTGLWAGQGGSCGLRSAESGAAYLAAGF